MVRLHTINTLRCNRKDVDEGRLSLEATKVDVRGNAARTVDAASGAAAPPGPRRRRRERHCRAAPPRRPSRGGRSGTPRTVAAVVLALPSSRGVAVSPRSIHVPAAATRLPGISYPRPSRGRSPRLVSAEYPRRVASRRRGPRDRRTGRRDPGRVGHARAGEESAFDREFLVHLLPTLEWPSLRDAARAVGVTLPDALDDALKTDEAFLRALHHILFDVHVVEGSLRCVESGQVFPISDGRPNMMLPEEVV